MRLFEVQGEFAGEIVMQGFVVADSEENAIKQVDNKDLDEIHAFEVMVKGYNIILEKTE